MTLVVCKQSEGMRVCGTGGAPRCPQGTGWPLALECSVPMAFCPPARSRAVRLPSCRCLVPCRRDRPRPSLGRPYVLPRGHHVNCAEQHRASFISQLRVCSFRPPRQAGLPGSQPLALSLFLPSSNSLIPQAFYLKFSILFTHRDLSQNVVWNPSPQDAPLPLVSLTSAASPRLWETPRRLPRKPANAGGQLTG